VHLLVLFEASWTFGLSFFAMSKRSAGIALFRRRAGSLELFLVHFGGPFWAKKDRGGWSFPKGEYAESEDALAAARREFQEETGFTVDGAFVKLDPIKQSGGKVIHLWAVEGDCDAAAIRSNTFTLELPRGSGKRVEFPEVDRADWFSPPVAREKLVAGQVGFVRQLCDLLGVPEDDA
jgi:predicted NUDIX family NTP pyrophosphohydrolase